MKNIIFCADGTWNHPKQMDDGLPADTNVRKLYDAFVQDATQVVLYDSGVGSGKPLLEHIFQGITGDGLLSKVMEGYRLIASQYLISPEAQQATAKSRAGMRSGGHAVFVALGDAPLVTKTLLGNKMQTYPAEFRG